MNWDNFSNAALRVSGGAAAIYMLELKASIGRVGGRKSEANKRHIRGVNPIFTYPQRSLQATRFRIPYFINMLSVTVRANVGFFEAQNLPPTPKTNPCI
jgi:hypothetical protein